MMPELTHKNHFKFGYNNIPFIYRERPQDKWFVSYGQCERPPLDFRSECIRTAQTIRQNTQDEIYVLFSGGVDSEVTLRSFVEAKIPVKAAILRFKNDLNIHDISWAIVVCNQLSIPYEIFELDLLKFWNGEALAYAERTYSVSPQLLTTMWLVDQVSGYPVLGSGECLFVKDIPDDYIPGVSPYQRSEWFLWEKEKIAAWYRHFMIQNRPGCPGFFQYTPEIMLSYLRDTYVQDLISDKIIGKLTTESSKLKIYQQHFPLYDRPKYTGFEKVQSEDAVLRKRLLELFPHANEVHKTSVTDLDAMLSTQFFLALENAAANAPNPCELF